MRLKNLIRIAYTLGGLGAALFVIGIAVSSKSLFEAGVVLMAAAVLLTVPALLSETVPRTRLLSTFTAAVALLILIWLVVPALHQSPLTGVTLVLTMFGLAVVWWRVERSKR